MIAKVRPAAVQSFFTGNSTEPMSLEEAVWVDPGRMSGTPCFRGTRVPVQQLFDWLADGVEPAVVGGAGLLHQ